MKKLFLASILILGLSTAYADDHEQNAHKCNANRCGGDQNKLLINGNKDVKKSDTKKTDAKKVHKSKEKKEVKK